MKVTEKIPPHVVFWQRYRIMEAMVEATDTRDFTHMEEHMKFFSRENLLGGYLRWRNMSEIPHGAWGICVARWSLSKKGKEWDGIFTEESLIDMFKHIAIFYVIGAKPKWEKL